MSALRRSAEALGPLPYAVVGRVSIPSTSLAEANPHAYAEAMRQIPRGVGVGTCAICGMGIQHNWLVQSGDGKVHPVGSDCVTRVGTQGVLLKGQAKAWLQRERQEARVRRARQALSARLAELEAWCQRSFGLAYMQVVDLHRWYFGRPMDLPEGWAPTETDVKESVEAAVEGPPALVLPDPGRQVVTGRIVGLKSRAGFGGRTEWKALLDCGCFKVWMTCPKKADKNDLVRVRVELVPKEVGFAIGKRPSLVEVLQKGSVGVV